MAQDQPYQETYFFLDDLSFTQKSIAFSGAKLWNEIPVNIKRAVSLDSFKDKLKAYYLQLQTDT